MTDEPRDDGREEGEEGPGDAPGEAESQAPPPATWAGRARAGAQGSGEEQGAGGEDDPQAPAEDDGLTDEFESLEVELSAELGQDEGESGEAAPDPADEQPEPPDEFEFAHGDGAEDAPAVEEEAEVAEAAEEAEAADGAEAAEHAGAPEPPDDSQAERAEEPAPGDTVEADTVAASEREAREEAAHAGLRARTAAGTARVGTATTQVAGAVSQVPLDAGEPPKRSTLWRFVAGAFVVVAATASATAIAFLLYLTDIGNDLRGDESFANAVERSLSDVEGGEPQTILILGSDKRTSTPGDPGRSDTTMLLRVDPDKEFLALLSLPRDLIVEIPGYGRDKLNNAYSYGEQFEAKNGGGPQLTLQTVKRLLRIDINHIVNVDFSGFYDAINAIGCVYVDVDRHYFNPVGGEYDDIDIQPGYTKLCGYRALDYVRYRHNDNDLVRGARQQSFVREARQQIPPRSLLPPPFGDAELIDIFTKHTTSDIDDAPTIVDMLKSFVEVRNASVRQVSLGELTLDGGVDASRSQIKEAVSQFLGEDVDEPKPEVTSPGAEPEPERKPKRKRKKGKAPEGVEMVDVTEAAEVKAREFDGYMRQRNAGLGVYYPTAVVPNDLAGISEESRAHVIEPPQGTKKPYRGYKFVLPYHESFGTSYYGLAGVNWSDPPILNNPSEIRRIDGRDYLIFFERNRVRLVGWTQNGSAHWVSNTLTRALSEDQMLAVATATREYRR